MCVIVSGVLCLHVCAACVHMCACMHTCVYMHVLYILISIFSLLQSTLSSRSDSIKLLSRGPLSVTDWVGVIVGDVTENLRILLYSILFFAAN